MGWSDRETNLDCWGGALVRLTCVGLLGLQGNDALRYKGSNRGEGELKATGRQLRHGDLRWTLVSLPLQPPSVFSSTPPLSTSLSFILCSPLYYLPLPCLLLLAGLVTGGGKDPEQL